MENLSIAAASAIQQNKVLNQIDVAIVGKSQQIQKQQGDAIVALIEQAAQVQQQLSSGHLDVKL
jgi:hypothetical protein